MYTSQFTVGTKTVPGKKASFGQFPCSVGYDPPSSDYLDNPWSNRSQFYTEYRVLAAFCELSGHSQNAQYHCLNFTIGY